MFATLEAMSDGGVRAGLPRQQALLLAAQTMKVRRALAVRHSWPCIGRTYAIRRTGAPYAAARQADIPCAHSFVPACAPTLRLRCM